MPELVLGVDIGTGSSKGMLTRPDGTVVAATERSHPLSLPRPGHAEMDADRVWWSDLVEICRELVAAAGEEPIAAVCVSGLGPCLLPCDDELRPLRPAILYGIDTRASGEVAELSRRYGDRELLARGGKLLSSQAVGPKLLWLRRHEPEVWRRTTRWFTSSSYLVARLSGAYVLDHHTASQCDPLYDLPRREWAADVVADVVGDHLPMPELAWPGEVVGRVTPEAAAATGLPVGTAVLAGTMDVMAESLSCGVRAPGDLMLMYGSTVYFMQVVDEYRTHPGLWTTTGADAQRLAVAGGMATSGSLTTWVRDLTGADFATLLNEAAQVAPGSEGLLVLPHFAGERTPYFDPHARGVVAGLTLRHQRGHLFRATYEGIAYGIRRILDLVEDACGPPQRIVSVGGGTASGLWTQIVSDVTGRSQLVPAQAVGASYGDAFLASVAAGLTSPDADWTVIEREVHADPTHAGTYDELYKRFVELHTDTLDDMHRLAELQELSG
jgi:xylulokinase